MDFPDISQQIASLADTYHDQQPPELLTLLSNQIALLWRWLKDLLNSWNIDVRFLDHTNIEGNFLEWCIKIAVFLCTFVVITLIWLQVKKWQNNIHLTKHREPNIEVNLDYAMWRAQALHFAHATNFKDAIRALYLSLLKLLDERGLARYAPTKTNLEYFNSLSTFPSIQAVFQELTSLVEEVWFGYRDTSNEDFSYCLERLEEIERELNQLPRAK